MHSITRFAATTALAALVAAPAAFAQSGPTKLDTLRNPEIQTMVARLDLEKYKAMVKGLTQFGDRRQGTARNRKAVDWIEAQLKSYGCTNTERITYTYTTPPPRGWRRTTVRRAAIRPDAAVVQAAPDGATGGRAARACAACVRAPA